MPGRWAAEGLIHGRPAATAQSRLLSKLNVSGDHHPDGHMPVDRVVLGVQRAAAGVEADLAAEVACQLAGQPAAVYFRPHGLGGAGCYVPAWLGGRGHYRGPGRLHSLHARRRCQTGVQRPAECRRIPVPPPSDRVAGAAGCRAAQEHLDRRASGARVGAVGWLRELPALHDQRRSAGVRTAARTGRWRGRSVPPCSGTRRPPGASPASCWREDASGRGDPAHRDRPAGAGDGGIRVDVTLASNPVAGPAGTRWPACWGSIPSSSWTGTCCK
jgi:hypothetical protein